MTRIGPASSRSPIPEATEPAHIGATANQPAPDRDMWQPERESPWMLRLYSVAFIGAIVGSAIWARFGS